MSSRSTPPGLPRLFTLDDVAEATHRSYATVLSHVKDGRLRTVRPGGSHRHLVTEAAFEAYLTGTPEPQPEAVTW